MADDAAQPEGADPFSDLMSGAQPATVPLAQTDVAEPAHGAPEGQDPFADILAPNQADQAGGGLGAASRSFERSIVPTAGGIVGQAFGSTIGASAGEALGPFGGVVGALGGGFLGNLGGTYLAGKAQDFVAQALPDDWKDILGGNEKQQESDIKYHPTETFLGGVAPYALTLRPSLGIFKALAPNATAYQRVAAALPHLFGGAIMGGYELGQEAASGQTPDWRNIGISTGMGIFFKGANRIGEPLEQLGARAAAPLTPAVAEFADTVAGRLPEQFRAPANENAPAPQPAPSPTVAQAGDAKVMGPGITEDVFMGAHQQSPQAEMAAQDTARTEQSVLSPDTLPRPDVGAVARKMQQELFTQYDALSQQESDLRARLGQLANPSDEDVANLTAQRDQAQQELTDHIASRNGYEGGPQARAMRAQVRDAQNQIDEVQARRDAFTAGNGVDTPEMTALRQQLTKTRESLWDLGPQVAAANRRAADVTGAGVVEPEAAPAPAPVAEQGQEPAASPAGPSTAEIQQQAAAIAASVSREMIAAGRPADEAELAGQLVAHRTVARAARMNGVLGNPLDLHNTEGAIIRGQAAPEPEAVTPKPRGRPPKVPKPIPEVDPAQARAAADSAGVTKLVSQLMPTSSDKEISDFIGRKLSEPQVAALRKASGVEAAPELAQQAPGVPEGEMTRQALAEYLRNGGSVSGSQELRQKMMGGIVLNPTGVPGRDFIGVEGVRPIMKLMQSANSDTIIHESGHQWLGELLRDAEHPAATDGIKADAALTRKWLKMDEAGAPLRRHQEKFANAAIQYMREGIAPSQGLARVFAQFKTWLSTIYQTAKGLGAPISDDIRGVFDRLLTAEPSNTVIHEPAEPGQSMATLHENDAATIAPHEAEPAMDRVGAEAQRYIEEIPPEVRNELTNAESRDATAANAGAESANGAEQSGQVVQNIGGPNAEPAGGSGSGEPGTVGGGGAAAGQEGAGVAGRPSGAGNAESGLRSNGPEPVGATGPDATTGNAIAPSATEQFGARESPLVDKAGNIRLDNLGTTADVANAIRLAANEKNDFIGDRRGVITDGQVQGLADALGMDAAQINQRQLGQAFNAEQIVAARKLLIQSATNVADLARRAADGSDEDVIAYAEAKARHNMIQGQVSGVTAEAGRALRAFRRLEGQWKSEGIDSVLRKSQARTLFQLKAEAKLMAGIDTPEGVSKFSRDMGKADAWDYLLEYWTNALISNPATHATYAMGNEIMSLLKAAPETAVAAAIGRFREATGRDGTRVHLAEVAAQLGAHLESIPGALKAAGQSAELGTTTLLPGEKPRNLPFQSNAGAANYATYDPAYQYRDILPDLLGSVRGILDGTMVSGYLGKVAQGVDGAPTISFQPSRTGLIPNVAYRGVTVLPTGEAARLPSRMVGSIHSFFRATNYSMELSRIATRQAIEEGLTGTVLDQRIAQLRQNPTDEMMQQSRGVASELTLMGQGGQFVQALSRLTNQRVLGIPILKFVDPFVKISGNVINQAVLQRTPVGLLSSELRADLSGRNGNIAQDTAQARMLVGTAMAIGFGSLAARGLITGSGPSDPNKAAIWRMAGYQPHSVRIGDTWYSVGHLGSLGMLMGISADMYDVAHKASDGQMLEAGSALQHAFTQNILDESFARGPAELLQAVEDPGRYGSSYIRNFVSSFVPYSSALRQMDRMSDPYSRQARSVMDGIKSKVPGMSEDLLPWRDIFGNPEPNLPSLGGMTSIYASQMQRDPVYQAMVNLGINVGAPSKDIRGVKLTDQQYDAYSRLAGRMAKQRLDTITTSPQWATWAPSTQADVISETFTQSREAARGTMMARFPQIASQAVRQKRAQLQRPAVQ